MVDPGFWLVPLLLGWRAGWRVMLLWVVAVFVSVLVHELGHAFASMSFGGTPKIALMMFGGLTHSEYPKGFEPSRLQSALVTVAGPGAGFLMALVAYFYQSVAQPPPESTAMMVSQLFFWINVFWGLVNLVPVLPLDGGHLMRAILSGPGPEAGFVRALFVTVVVGPVAALVSGYYGYIMAAVFFGVFSFRAGTQLHSLSRATADFKSGLGDRLDAAVHALNEQDYGEAFRIANGVASMAKSKQIRMSAIRVKALALMNDGKPAMAIDVLDELPPEESDPFAYGICLCALGKMEEAVPALERAVEMGVYPNALVVLIDVLEKTGQHKRADALKSMLEQGNDGQDC